MSEIETRLKLSEIKRDDRLYPRTKTDWVTIHTYKEAMISGAKFPPVAVAKLDDEFVLIDGWHRFEATRQLKKEDITVEILPLATRQEAFIESIKRNIVHGRQFSAFEKITLATRLEKMNISSAEVSKILNISETRMVSMKGARLKFSPELNEEIVVKSPLKHLDEISEEQNHAQNMLMERSQTHILDTMINMLMNKMFDLKDKRVKDKLYVIRKLLE